MMQMYVLIDKSGKHDSLSFMKLEDLEAYKRAFNTIEWETIRTKHITHINAQKYINWADVPDHLSFIFRDHEGVKATQYRPSKHKWFGQFNDKFKMYGGEHKLLDYQFYHELMQIGDVFENPVNNKHFIRWNTVKGAFAIKFIDTAEQIIEVFSDHGELLYSGSNDEIKMILKENSLQFHVFPWQTYTFVKE